MSTSHIKGPLLPCIGDMEVPSNSRWPSHLWKIPREIVPLLDQERGPGVVGRLSMLLPTSRIKAATESG